VFFLAWRQLIARKKQTFLIILGISFGTLLFVSISGLQLGMRKFITERLLNNTAHVLISGAERLIDPTDITEVFYGKEKVHWISLPFGKREEVRLQNVQNWYQALKQDPQVFDFSPRLSTNAILSNGAFTASVGLVGVVAEKQLATTSIQTYMQEGSFKSLSSGNGNIVIGSEVAKHLGARMDQFIRVSNGNQPGKPFKVVGIVHFGNVQADGSIAYADLNHVQSLIRSPGRVSEIAVTLFDINNSATKAAEWKMRSGDQVQDWQEANKNFMEMIRVQDYTRYFITSTILIVAAFGIYNVLTIMISQKRKEIAILQAIGYGPDQILKLVLYQGLVLGITGGILGLVLGYILCVIIGRIDLGIELGSSRNLQISYDIETYVFAFVAANIASLLSSYFPARTASRLTPMEIMRADS
jgi:lipoprotein-releasing system permease protein